MAPFMAATKGLTP